LTPRASDTYNLSISYPEIAKEWHSEKNEQKPTEYAPYSSSKVWWKCEKGHEWAATIQNRVRGSGCPFCIGRRASETYNLAVVNPSLVNDWHPTKNESLLPTDVTPGSNLKVWWKCEQGHEWEASIGARAFNKLYSSIFI